MATKPMPSISSGMLKAKRDVPVLTSVPMMPNRRPRIAISTALSTEPCASAIAETRPSTIRAKYSAASNFKATSASGGAKAAITMVAMVPAKNEPSAAMHSAAPARPLPGHLMAVDHRDDRRHLARQIDQDRRGRAAVGRAVIDAGEHDQRRHGRQPVGDRQQHCDGRHRADARQDADESADQRAQESVAEIDRRERDAEPERQVCEDIHYWPPPMKMGQTGRGIPSP